MKHNFTPQDLRESLGLFATGIAIATATDGAERVGITINSFASVSLDPPLVLFSASRKLHSFSVFERAPGFAINVLRKDQKELSARFAKPGADKWLGVASADGDHGGILIYPSLAVFDCKLHRHYEGGDHVIFVGEVVNLVAGQRHDPLVYFRSTYHEINSAPLSLAA